MPLSRLLSLVLVLLSLWSPTGRAEAPFTGPWDLADLKKPPKVTWIDPEGPVRRLTYESEPRNGRPTRVFAWYAQPKVTKEKRLPAVVLVHGGGGQAFKQWAELWAARGYAALAMDLAGRDADRKRLPDGGPDQDGASKFPPQKTNLRDVWTYHAVAAVIRGVSLVRSLPQVDPERIGITGISWGGYLTCIVAGLDDRLKAAVPVYGCGFLHEDSAWLNTFARLPAEWRKQWVENFDPSRYLAQTRCPILFVNGTNDFAYPLDSYQKSYRLVKDRKLCVTVRMPHGHPAGWAPVEIGLFMDQHLRGGVPLPSFKGEVQVKEDGKNRIAEAAFTSPGPISRAALHWTTDTTGPWQKRNWQSKEFSPGKGNLKAELPSARPVIFFLTITDNRKATVSTEHRMLGQ
jgi:dienelactone hydrolase